jgi:WD40 repeat protein
MGRRSLLPRIHYTRDLSPDGRMLAYQGLLSDRRVFVVSTETGQELHRFDRRDRRGGVIIPVFSRNGKLLVLGDGDEDNPDEGLFLAYDVATWEERWRFKASSEFFEDFDISPDGRTLAARWVRTLVVYDTATGRVRHRLDVGSQPWESLTAYAFAPDGASIVATQSDGTIRLWDLATGRERRRFGGDRWRTTSLGFTPDSRILAASGMDGGARLLDVAAGRELARLEGHRGYVTAMAFSPDGRRLATGGEDTTVLTWDLAAFEGVATAPDRVR